MTSPNGSDLPEKGLFRTASGRAGLVVGGLPRAIAPLVEDQDWWQEEFGEEVEADEIVIESFLGVDADIEQLFALAAEEEPDPTLLDEGFAPPFEPQKIVALGRTFAAHAKELGNEAPKEPLVFGKLPENLVGSGSSLFLPDCDLAAERFDNEIELAAIIGADLDRADEAEADAAITAWMILNDFTWRSAQDRAKKAGQPWFLAKNLPGAIPCGPAVVPRFALPDPVSCRLRTSVNGEVVQDTDYTGIVRSPAALVAWLSARLPLNEGDLVALGTPAGVSSVAPGSRVEASVEGLGTLRFRIEGGRS